MCTSAKESRTEFGDKSFHNSVFVERKAHIIMFNLLSSQKPAIKRNKINNLTTVVANAYPNDLTHISTAGRVSVRTIWLCDVLRKAFCSISVLSSSVTVRQMWVTARVNNRHLVSTAWQWRARLLATERWWTGPPGTCQMGRHVKCWSRSNEN